MNRSNFGPKNAYPLHAFHLISENAAREVRWHTKAPDAMVGMSFVHFEAVCCQGLADVAIPILNVKTNTLDGPQAEADEDKSFHLIPLALNLLSLGETGERKTTVDRMVGAPIYAHDEKRAIAHQSDLVAYDTDQSIWQSIDRGLRRKLVKLTGSGEPTYEVIVALKQHAVKKPLQPRLRRIVRSDITKTAIAQALHGEGEIMALMSNEGDIVLHSEAMKHLSWLNSAWDGSSLSLDRANNRNFLARNPRVTTSLMVQPDIFHDYMVIHGDKARKIGYFARYLVGWPRSTQGQRFISGNEGSLKHLAIFHARLKELLAEYDRRVATGAPWRDVIHFTEEAKARWIDLVNNTEQLIQPSGALREVKDFAAKACEVVARVAGILHYFSGQIGGITIDTLERAIVLVGWHMDECERIFVQENEVSQALQDAEKLRSYFYRKQQEALENNKDPRNKPIDPFCIARSEARHGGPLRKGRFWPALEVLVARDVVRVGPLGSISSGIFRKSAGPLYVSYSSQIGYPLQF